MIAIIFLIFFALVIIGVPIALCMGLAGLIPVVAFTDIPIVVIMQKFFTGVDSLSLLAIPFFMLSGGLLDKGGVSRRLVDFANSLVGWLPGGLAGVTFLACAFFGAISGSSSATVVAMGALLVPAMLKEGYPLRFTLATIACGGWLGIVIPPSTPMIIYGIATGTSTGSLFMGGFIPGFMCAAGMAIYAVWYGKYKLKLKTHKFSLRKVGKSFVDAIWALVMPLIILGGIYGGVFTPTEAAAVACLYGIIVGFLIYRELSWKDMGSILLNTVKTSSMILFIIAAATAFAYVLTIENVPNIIAGAVMSFATEKWQFWVFVTILLFITGMVMETTPAIMILAPILMPMLPQYGIDPVAFGVVMIINLGIGYVTPPVGLNLYVAAGLVPGAKVGDVVNKHTVVYILLAFIVLIVLMAFPQIIMLLPNMME